MTRVARSANTPVQEIQYKIKEVLVFLVSQAASQTTCRLSWLLFTFLECWLLLITSRSQRIQVKFFVFAKTKEFVLLLLAETGCDLCFLVFLFTFSRYTRLSDNSFVAWLQIAVGYFMVATKCCKSSALCWYSHQQAT